MNKIITLENQISPPLLRAVAATWPAETWPHWHRYRDETADKYATKDAHRIPDAAKLVIADLAKLRIDELLGLSDCFPDLDLHGAGLHMSCPGGFLGLHLDGAVHPLTGWSRAANAILFVDDWQPDWGGELQMCDAATRDVIESVEPRCGRIALFATNPTAWHQVTTVRGPMNRRTISLFWWSEARSNSDQDRAMFVPGAY